MKKIILLLAFLMPLIVSQAQETAVKKSDIIETYRGQRVYIHFVEKGETLSAISRAYGVSIDQIKKTNPESSEALKPYQILMVPVTDAQEPVKEKAAEVSVNGIIPDTKVSLPVTTTTTTPTPAVVKVPSGMKPHLVAPKETWYALSRRYEVPVKELILANQGVDTLRIGATVFIPEKKENTGTLDVIPGYSIYKAQAGETLFSIAKAHTTTVDELIRLNPELENGLKSDQSIYVPGGASTQPLANETIQEKPSYIEHKVERKETLYSISKFYGVEQFEILKLNPGIDGILRKNDIIKIPVKTKEKAVQQPKIPDTLVLGQNVHQQAIEVRESGPCKPVEAGSKVFEIALFVPLSLERVDSITTADIVSLSDPASYRSFDFIQFYEGALIAIDKLSESGMKLKVHVYDTDAGDGLSKTRKIIASGDLKKMDLMIGPMFANSFELTADYAKDHKIPIVNPLSGRTEILENNPFVIKAQPSGWSQYNGAASQLVAAYPQANFVVVRRNATENSSMADAFESALQKNVTLAQLKKVNFSLVHDAGLMAAMVPGKTNVVLFLTNDKALIPASLRKLNDVAEKYKIVMVGLSEWEDMELDINYLQKLNAHFFKPWFVEYTKPETVDFIAAFRNRFVAEPEEIKYAYLGYDITSFFLGALKNYGTGFLNCLPFIEEMSLSASFRFYQSANGGYENTGIVLYQLKDYKRKKVE